MSKKNLGEASLVTSMQQTDDILIETGGSVRRVTLEELRSAVLGDYSLGMMADNVFIFFGQTSSPRMCRVDSNRYQSYGAIGIGVIAYNRILVIALEETQMYWNTQSGACNTLISDREDAIEDMDGKANTAAIVASATYTGGTDCAAGYCNAYSKFSTTGYGIGAGSWWLPSAGEMAIIQTNFFKINYALNMVGGTALRDNSYYWTSTERTAANAWSIYATDVNFVAANRTTSNYYVRPVSGYQDLTTQ